MWCAQFHKEKFKDEELIGLGHGRIWCRVSKHGLKHGRVARSVSLFLYEVNSIRGDLGEHGLGHGHVSCGGCKVRLKVRPCGMWCVQFLCIFENYERLRGIDHARVLFGGPCATKLNCKYQHPNVGFRLWPKHKSCRKHLKVFRCQIWQCSDIVWLAKSSWENS